MLDSLAESLKRYRRKLAEFRESPRGERTVRYLTWTFQAVVLGVIIYQLTGIGWGTFLAALPDVAMFYALFLLIYFLLPFSEALAYKICWGTPYLHSIPIFLKKRIFNKDVMGYSGEVVLLHWATQSIPRSRRQLFRDIRDMNIISSAASTMVGVGLLVFLVLTGQIQALNFLFDGSVIGSAGVWDYTVGGAIALAIILIAYRFRDWLFSMPVGIASKVFSIHFLRMLLLYSAEILQWHLVLPEIGLEIWFTFLSIRIIISRIPFIPSQDLVATSTNIELARVLNVSVAPVSGLFLAHDVLGKIFNLFFYLYYSWQERRGKSVTAGDEQMVAHREGEPPGI
ncbi:MAG: hypothetical protein U5K31_11845 [Balneolaceae bacterium]|nr:hypothetical protein [Balneolaceae bacterium]